MDYGSRVLKISTQVKIKEKDIMIPQSDDVSSFPRKGIVYGFIWSMITIRNGIAYQKKEYRCGKDHRCIVFDFIILVNW